MCCYGNGRRGRPAESAVRVAFPTAVCELFELLLLTSYYDQQEFIKADRLSLFLPGDKKRLHTIIPAQNFIGIFRLPYSATIFCAETVTGASVHVQSLFFWPNREMLSLLRVDEPWQP